MSQPQIQELIETELKTKFVIKEKVNPELIAGFVLLVGDKLIDGSISGGLRKLKQEFEKNPYIKA